MFGFWIRRQVIFSWSQPEIVKIINKMTINKISGTSYWDSGQPSPDRVSGQN